jgi:3-oxoacyl-[acyl-carrier protein] reductase
VHPDRAATGGRRRDVENIDNGFDRVRETHRRGDRVVMLAGKFAVVNGAGTALGAGLVRALESAGATVATHDGLFRSRKDVNRLAAVNDAVIDVLVHTAIESRLLEPVDLLSIAPRAWDATMQSTLYAVQGAFDGMQGGRGRIIVLIPTVGLTGTAGLVHLAAAVEGQRLLAKSAARQWGPLGITVNCVAVAPELVVAAPMQDLTAISKPVLGRDGDPQTDLGPIVEFLASDASHFVTGTTITADGGVWLYP